MPDYEAMILARQDTFDECGYCDHYEDGVCPGQCWYNENYDMNNPEYIEAWANYLRSEV